MLSILYDFLRKSKNKESNLLFLHTWRATTSDSCLFTCSPIDIASLENAEKYRLIVRDYKIKDQFEAIIE